MNAIFQFIRDTRFKWRAASLYGCATKAQRAGESENALILAEKALNTLDQSGRKGDPDAIAIRLTSTVLIAQLSSELNRECPRSRILECLSATEPFAGHPQFDDPRKWLQSRLVG